MLMKLTAGVNLTNLLAQWVDSHYFPPFSFTSKTTHNFAWNYVRLLHFKLYARGLKLKLTRGPQKTQRKVSRAALKISEKITF